MTTNPSTRPQEINETLSSLERFNLEKITIFQDYVVSQCATGTYDLLANLALLKMYQFNAEQAKEDTIVNILSKALTAFPEPDFTLSLHLLNPSVLQNYPPSGVAKPQPPKSKGEDSLTLAVHRLTYLNILLESASFSLFWSTLQSDDDEYADLVADVKSFDDEIRKGITRALALAVRSIKIDIAQSWWNFTSREQVEKWVQAELPGWQVNGDDVVKVETDDDDDVTQESVAAGKSDNSSGRVKFEQLSRLIKRVYENEAAVILA
ncbi:armadillo-type protein [Lipomyces japonicus]|uniref:armadillo-type protein n=1 Tax=Lipomyces japonicus TaxID=56871 RepID=UPI0034D017B7